MLLNNLDPEVGEKPEELVVYGGTGKVARNWECFHAIVRWLKSLEADETLLVQSGKPVGIFRTHEYAPRVLLCNSNLVGHWNNWDRFHELDRAGLLMYGQMTAGSWIYIGAQGILQVTYETGAAAGEEQFGGKVRGLDSGDGEARRGAGFVDGPNQRTRSHRGVCAERDDAGSGAGTAEEKP